MKRDIEIKTESFPEIQTKQGVILKQGIDINQLLQIPDPNKVSVKTLGELINVLEKDLKTNEISQRIYEFLKELGLPSKIKEVLDIDEIKLGGALFLTLTRESKRTITDYLFSKYLRTKAEELFGEKPTEEITQNYIKEQKEWIKEKIGEYTDFDTEFWTSLEKLKWIDNVLYYYITTHALKDYDEDNYEDNYEVIQAGVNMTGEKSYENLVHFLNRFANTEKNPELEELFDGDLKEIKRENTIHENGDIPMELQEQNKDLLLTRNSDKEGFVSFNAHFTELNLSNGVQLFGETKFKKIYTNYFAKIAKEIVEKSKGKEIKLYNIYSSKLKDLDNKVNRRETSQVNKLQEKRHHIIEREIDENFDIKSDLYNIGKLIKKYLPDFNLNISKSKDYDIKAITTMNGDIQYRGMFTVNSGFENSNILVLNNKSTGEKRLRLALECDNVAQDEFIYLTSQIAYFLKNKKFIDSKQLFSEMYHKYNQISLKNVEVFDIEILEEQYGRFIKDIVRPLSVEYQEKYGTTGKIKNTALVGLHGTGKSQFLFNLLKHKEFKYKGKVYHMNANVLNMSVITFASIVTQDASVLKKKLSDIFDNTGIPILLVIEDLDVLINEDGKDYDIATQSITTFFDGVGSVPVNIITASNYPERISPRLLRPNRLENITMFNMPLPVGYRTKILDAHIQKNNIEKDVDLELLKSFCEKTKKRDNIERFTSSHLGAFIKKIKDHIDFEREDNPDYKINSQEIQNIYDNMLLGINDIKERQNQLEKRLTDLQSKTGREKVGYNTDFLPK